MLLILLDNTSERRYLLFINLELWNKAMDYFSKYAEKLLKIILKLLYHQLQIINQTHRQFSIFKQIVKYVLHLYFRMKKLLIESKLFVTARSAYLGFVLVSSRVENWGASFELEVLLLSRISLHGLLWLKFVSFDCSKIFLTELQIFILISLSSSFRT